MKYDMELTIEVDGIIEIPDNLHKKSEIEDYVWNNLSSIIESKDTDLCLTFEYMNKTT